MQKKRIIVLGATGMVGECTLRLCLDNPEVVQVTSIVRRVILGIF